MSLAIHATGGPRAAIRGESYLERVLKLVPAEVVTFYTLALSILASPGWKGWPLVLFTVGTILVPVLLYWDAARAGEAVPVAQYVVRTLAFAAWAFMVGEPSAGWFRLDPRIAPLLALLLPILGERIIARGRP